MNALRWIVPASAVVFFSLVGCNDEAPEEGSDTTVIEDREPDVIIEEDDDPDIRVEDRDPDIRVEEDDGFEADIDVEDGKVEGEVRVED